jgi:uncharacterized SAM-binding protein YcdF (DUF218 family)
MKKADVIIVLGRGIYKDGLIPESAQASIKKAVELYKNGKAGHITFSGKWSYSLDYTPPITEARAMANFSRDLGLPEQVIKLEEESDNTLSNCYYIKTRLLEPNNWKHIILITIDPQDKRAPYHMEKILGSGYAIETVPADFSFSEEKRTQLAAIEKQKMENVVTFYQDFTPGDHEAIFHKSKEYLTRK